MEAEFQAQIAFHRRIGDSLESRSELGLRPALLASYRDLTKLRYDFPLVLIEGVVGETAIQSLSTVFDRVIEDVASGTDGERLRQHALRLEQQIRALAAQGAVGSLRALWDRAERSLCKHDDELFQNSLRRLSAALKIDGDVVDCVKSMPFRVLRHARSTSHAAKTQAFNDAVQRLTTKLSDVLTADFVHSEKGLSAENLKAAVGVAHQDIFDFDAMAHLLTQSSPKTPLPDARRRRIEWLLSVFKSQRFFQAAPVNTQSLNGERVEPYEFVFDNCVKALEAYHARLPAMKELAKAMAIAEIEIDGRYNGSKHDLFFEEYGDDGLSAEELAFFPDYLLCVGPDEVPNVVKAFVAGLPAKVLVQTDDLLAGLEGDGEHIALALAAKQLAGTAIALIAVYVLQSTSSNLLQMRGQILRGLSYPGPALFNIFSGATEHAGDLPPYLIAAAAFESRAFPNFVYDPSSGADLASRVQVQGNPQPDRDWPVYSFAYEAEEFQRVVEELPFTLIDFIACDRRYAKYFAGVHPSKRNGSMGSVTAFLGSESNVFAEKVPALLMVDSNNVLQTVVVDGKLIQEARRCTDMWRSLRELGGIRNSHAERLLARERHAWVEHLQKKAQPSDRPPSEQAAAPAIVPPGAAVEIPQLEPKSSSGDPYIETPRCTSCNECTHINDKMFAYDANKQAYITDPGAGTYRQLVEAAESCQVAIIHPGKPRNPNEPGLDELMKRAESFL